MGVSGVVMIAGFVATIIYLVELYLVASRIKIESPEAWETLGAPELSDVNGLWVWVKVVFGVEGRELPWVESQQSRLKRIRIALVFGLVAALYVLVSSLIG